jgi:hypothetical protein
MMKHTIMHAILLMAVMGLLALTGAVFAQEPAVAPETAPTKAELPKLAVKVLEGKGIDASTAATLTDVLCTRLAANGKYQVICSSDVAAILNATQQTALLGQCDDDSCYEVLGKVLDAEYIVVGSIGKVGESYVISLSLIKAEDKLTKARVTHEVKGDESRLLEGIRNAADKLLAN